MASKLDAIPVHRASTDLRRLLTSTVKVMDQQAHAAEVVLKLTIDEDLPKTVAVDRDKIAWAIATLVGNSLRYVRRGTRLMPGGRIDVRGKYDEAASRVILEVEDDGPGMPQERVAQLFERSEADGHIAGLALQLVREVVLAHGGELDVKSSVEPGKSGTVVRLLIPHS